MSKDPVYLPLLYRCQAGHYHLIIGNAIGCVSNPFESLVGAVLLRQHMKPNPDASDELNRKCNAHLVGQIDAASRKMRRDKRGRFTRLDMLRGEKLQPWEGQVMPLWFKFLRGEINDVGFSHWWMGMQLWVPLTCDFLHHEGAVDGMSVQQLEKLPRRLRSWEEMNITLKVATED